MMVTKVKINPAMMKWARTYAGFTNGHEDKLPQDIKQRYESWEKGDNFPTWNQLRKVSKKYKVPTAFFFMNKPPEYDNLPKLINYRKVDTNLIFENKSPSLISNIRKSETRREIYLELLEDMHEEIKLFKTFDGPLDKYAFSKYIRNSLDVSLDTQKSWFNEGHSKDYKHYKFLRNWKHLLNNKLGILVFETVDVDIKEMRGLCIFYDEVPIILLNGKDSVNGRIFSLFHELTHLLLGESAICDDDVNYKEEVFCNSVAGEFLVPTDDLKDMLKDGSIVSDSLLKRLSNTYGVSEYVILRRLYDTNLISKSFYDSKTSEFDDVDNSEPKKRGGGSYLRNQVKYNGREYYSLVLAAYDSGVIGSSDFTKFTNLGQKHIPRLHDELFEGE